MRFLGRKVLDFMCILADFFLIDKCYGFTNGHRAYGSASPHWTGRQMRHIVNEDADSKQHVFRACFERDFNFFFSYLWAGPSLIVTWWSYLGLIKIFGRTVSRGGSCAGGALTQQGSRAREGVYLCTCNPNPGCAGALLLLPVGCKAAGKCWVARTVAGKGDDEEQGVVWGAGGLELDKSLNSLSSSSSSWKLAPDVC